MRRFLNLIAFKSFLPLVALFIMIPLAIPASSAGQLTGKLVITGSSTIAPVMSEIGKRFELLHPGVRVDVQTGGSSRGIADVREGLADIGMSSRPLKDQEEDGLTSSLLARDGVCFLVHKNNPINELSDQQIRDIFIGKLTHWNQVGGLNAPITVINRADGRSELELFSHHFQIKPTDIKAHLIAGDNEQGIKTLAGNPNAIIYMSVGTSEYDAAQGVPLKLLPLNGIAASTENIRNGSFPFARPLVLVTKPNSKPLAKAFLEFALSSKVHDVIRELSFVPIQ